MAGIDSQRTPGPAARPPVYLDANPLADKHLTGIGRYTARLAMAIKPLAEVRFFSGNQEIERPAGLDWDPDQDLGTWARQVWRGKRKPLGQPPRGSVGIYGCLRPAERVFDTEVSILHDFTPLVVPATHAASTRSMFQGFFGHTLLSSDLALSVSHSTKADAGWLTDFDQDRIVVAHSGPSLCVGRHASSEAVARRPHAGLVVATLEPRKNARFVLEWFRDSKAMPDDAELWWVGPLGWLTSRRELKKYASTGGRRLRFLGVVTDAALCRLYRTAGWTIYPSLYEGFGFPVVDALRHGTPVLASANSSLCEFDARGLYHFDPCDATTVDAAWRSFQASGPAVEPADRLDAHYDWRRVARTLLDACDRAAIPASRGREAAA